MIQRVPPLLALFAQGATDGCSGLMWHTHHSKEMFGKDSSTQVLLGKSVDVFVALQVRLPPRKRCFQPELLAIGKDCGSD